MHIENRYKLNIFQGLSGFFPAPLSQHGLISTEIVNHM